MGAPSAANHWVVADTDEGDAVIAPVLAIPVGVRTPDLVAAARPAAATLAPLHLIPVHAAIASIKLGVAQCAANGTLKVGVGDVRGQGSSFGHKELVEVLPEVGVQRLHGSHQPCDRPHSQHRPMIVLGL